MLFLIKDITSTKTNHFVIDVLDDIKNIKTSYMYNKNEKSLAVKNPLVPSQWDYEANGDL